MNEREKRITFYGNKDKSKKHFTLPPPPHHHKINNPPNFLVKRKETRNYVFLRVYMDQGLKEVKKMY